MVILFTEDGCFGNAERREYLFVVKNESNEEYIYEMGRKGMDDERDRHAVALYSEVDNHHHVIDPGGSYIETLTEAEFYAHMKAFNRELYEAVMRRINRHMLFPEHGRLPFPIEGSFHDGEIEANVHVCVPGLCCTRFSPYYEGSRGFIEIVIQDCTSLGDLLNHFGLSHEEAMYIGDGWSHLFREYDRHLEEKKYVELKEF